MFHIIARGARALAPLFTAIALMGCGAEETLLAVHASASTRSTPDLAIVTLGVVARGATAVAAQQAQTNRMQTVLDAARAAGAEDADIQTVGFSLEPQYVYVRGQAPRISGYISRNTVSLRLRDLNRISGLIDATVAQGANELHGITFTFEDDERVREAARAQALETARRRANVYAEAAGLEVVAIRSIVEPGSAFAPPDARRDGAFAAVLEQSAAAPVAPINPGQVDTDAAITVVFALR